MSEDKTETKKLKNSPKSVKATAFHWKLTQKFTPLPRQQQSYHVLAKNTQHSCFGHRAKQNYCFSGQKLFQRIFFVFTYHQVHLIKPCAKETLRTMTKQFIEVWRMFTHWEIENSQAWTRSGMSTFETGQNWSRSVQMPFIVKSRNSPGLRSLLIL